MVGYNPELERQLTKTDHAIAGAFSGSVSRALFQPLDVLKIRFQLQVEPVSRKDKTSKYTGIPQAVQKIIKEEGWKALWKGHVPAQALSILYGIVQIYRSLLHGTSTIVRQEGFLALYKGLAPTLFGVVPQMGLQFGFYTLFTGIWKNTFGQKDPAFAGPLESLVCGSGSGVVTKCLIYPLDVTKKRLQVQGFEKARTSFGETRRYHGMVHCLFKVFKEEGLRGIYKGLYPSLLKAAAVSGCHMCVYDQICRLIVWSRKL
ncbi:hypothetical protein ACJMK2_034644 [Sinanodonta woodiana]|uniref:Mitochondrial thiamine pyrophosphate carrier n=1 Tax=Sinanodonta woodiana TaxID=1069815 RepID=A0ABD3WSA2_SINWO